MSPDAVMRELAGLHALARSLVHGDADADDLLQETAMAAMAHPPEEDRPVRPWLATVLRNRWRMDRRGRARRHARERAAGLALAEDSQAEAPDPSVMLDRARALERLAAALAALEEPFRDAVIRRYLDGKSAAEIARALGVPPGTVRWRLKTGLERLRAALDRSTPRWQRALVPVSALKGALAVKAKTSVLWFLLLVLFLGGGTAALLLHHRAATRPVTARAGDSAGPGPAGSLRARAAAGPTRFPGRAGAAARPDPLPGQGRAVVEPVAADTGAVSGRVINWSTGAGVGGAELAFMTPAGLSTTRSGTDGAFELAATPGRFSLATIVAPGFLPYAPELEHSPVRITLAAHQAVRGLTLFLFPALDYVGTVVDAGGTPVAGARVTMVGSPAGEQTLESIPSRWTTDRQGGFTFHAPDGAVFEASHGETRGRAVLDGNVATTHRMTITLGDAPARDASIRGQVVDQSGAPLAGVLVSAMPERSPGTQPQPRSNAFATSADDGTFALEGLDRQAYALTAELDGFAPLRRAHVNGGTPHLVLTIDAGQPLAGVVRDPTGKPVPAYTLLVTRRRGVVREMVTTRSVIDPDGRFQVRVAEGDYELLVSATGWAPSRPVAASSGATDVRIDLSAGATVTGVVVEADTGAPIAYARVNREGASGGASAQPANAGTVTRTDGTFELTGIPPGPFTLSIGAGDHNPRLEGGLVATDGGTLGPIRIALDKLADGETPRIEFVGIGVKLSGDGDALRVDMVVPRSGAAAAGIVSGDHIVAVDDIPVTTLGMDGAVAHIRGVAHTTVELSVQHGDAVRRLSVERLPLKA